MASRQSIVFLDDDAFMLDLLTEMFSSLDYNVHAYSSRKDLLNNLILLDNQNCTFMLVDRFEGEADLLTEQTFIAKIRSLGYMGEISLMTNFASEEDIQHATSLGFKQVIPKDKIANSGLLRS